MSSSPRNYLLHIADECAFVSRALAGIERGEFLADELRQQGQHHAAAELQGAFLKFQGLDYEDE
ncbi:MAG: hypothetical protein H7330_07915 [Hymenobacteraceae bacterium]|nr:hypothetical protein [Hymenobacteraceae bacterium]